MSDWEDVPKASTNSGWEDVPKAPKSVPFESGSAFKDTKSMIPSMDDMKGAWEEFQKQWANRKNTPMTPEIAQKMMQDEKSAGSGVLDTVGALPAMIAGGAHGIYEGVKELDATLGLKKGMETMGKFLPSSLMGNEEHQKSEGYKTAMAPLTAAMDTLNAVPQGYGEIINAMGFDKAAAQVTDAGKLGIMVGAGALGAKGVMKGFKPKADKGALDAAAKLEALRKEAEVPKAPETETTAAHADDFGSINPYNVGGHVDAAKEGRPTTIDNPQGELFGGESLEQSPRSTGGETISAGEVLPSLRNSEGKSTYIGEPIPFDKNAGSLPDNTSVPMDHSANTLPWQLSPEDRAPTTNTGAPDIKGRENPNIRTFPEETILDSTVSKEHEVAREQQHRDQEQVKTASDKEAAFAEMGKGKDVEYNKMEAQRELDFLESTRNIEQGAGASRRAFLDRSNLDFQDAPAWKYEPKSAGYEFLKKANDAHLETLYADASAAWHKGSEEARHRMDDIANIQAQRRVERNYKASEGVVNDIHPGYKEIPEGTMVEFSHNGEVHRAPVEGSKSLRAMDGQWNFPRVRHPDYPNRLKTLYPDEIKAVFGGPKKIELDYQHAKNVFGDKTLLSLDKTTEMRNALAKGDVAGALATIAGNHPSLMYRTLAGFLASRMEGIKVSVHPDSIIKHGERDITGYYDPHSGSITLSGLGATSPHTFLHEAVHALTSQLMTLRPNDIRVKGMENLYKSIKGIEKEFPGIVNVREFVAEAFSNPKFQEFLKSKKYDNRSLWRKFTDGVKNMLGLKPGIETKLGNALDHALDLGKQIMEASDKKTRDDMLSIFKEAGMNNKLSDLMADKPKDVRADTSETPGLPEVVNGIPGLSSAISDFTFFDRDKPMSEIIGMAKQLPDIDKGNIESFSQQAQAGGLFQSLKTRNPVVKITFEKISRAVQESSRNIKNNLTAAETGLVARMRALSKDEKGSIWSAMMEHEGQRELSSTELAAKGFSEKEVAYYNKHREIDTKFFEDLNARRAELGMAPMDKRVAHIAGRFMGDFAMMVFKEGKVVGRIAGNSKWELKRAYEHIKEAHPEFEFGKQEYNGIGTGKRAGDRFGGMMEALNFLSKTDGDVGVLMDSYRDFLQKDAITFRNTIQHAKDKQAQAGGIIGSEGNKPWQDAIKNAEEGMKSQLSYFERGYEWMSMQKAISDLKPLLGDAEVVKQMPNAVEWAQKYVNHALNREQGKIADAANVVISAVGEATGLGHSNILKWNAQAKHLVMQKFMGLGNIPFSLTQLMQPFQAHPAMIRLLRTRGLEFSTASAHLKATETYLHALVEGHDSPKLSPFETAAMKYADQMSVFDVKMADHTRDINANRFVDGYNKLADLNITVPEHLTRGMSFLMYAHILKDAGVPSRDIFGAAENLTNTVMVDYRPIERPMGYAKLGWIGDLASTLIRYKHNQYSQLAFYGREGIRGAKEGNLKASLPLATFLGSSLAFGGLMGFFAYNEADSAYQLFSEHVMKKASTLNDVMTKGNVPTVLTHGIFSTLGIDMTTRFSNANLIPNSIPEAVMPYGSAVWDMAKNTGRFVLDPTSPTKAKQMAKSFAPQSAAGPIENYWFTEKQKDGKNLYINNTDGPNLGKGRIERTDGEMMQRNFGFRSVRESKELAANYSDSQIQKANKDLADGLLTKIKYAAMDDSLTPEKLQQYASKAMKDYGDDSIISRYVSWSQDRHLSQKQQKLLRDAQGGYKGAFNIKNSR